MELDTKKILESPEKIFAQKYNEMKSNYNEASAGEFNHWFQTQSLGLFLDHNVEIAKESYYGSFEAETLIQKYKFFTLLNIDTLENSMMTYVNDNKDKIPADQMKIYDRYLDVISDIKKQSFFSRYLINSCLDDLSSDDDDQIALDIRNSVYDIPIVERNDDNDNVTTDTYNRILIRTVKKMIEKVRNLYSLYKNPDDSRHRIATTVATIFVILQEIHNPCADDNEIFDFLKEFLLSLDNNRGIRIEFTILMRRLCNNREIFVDRYYGNMSGADSAIYNILSVIVGNRYIGDTEKELRAECCTEDVTHGSRFNAVNDILLDTFEDVDESFSSEKEFIESSVLEMYNAYFNIVKESFMDDIDFNINDYPALPSNISSYEEAFDFLLEKTNYAYFSEADDADSAVEKIETNIKHGKPKETLTKKIQNKAMDAEAKQAQKQAKRKEAVGNIAGAAKAVGNIPKNIMDDIKEIGKKIDEKDDERRKKFLAKPGFRKHIFKTLKLAILYGSAAQCKLALVPVVALLRHFSKEKDARIWNELQRELDTEIKVTEEKINDASANGDQEAKYKLIRIKEKLEQEKDRVKLNSKYI